MRELSWRYFTLTGNIEAYLLYRSQTQTRETEQLSTKEEEAEEAPAVTDASVF